MSLSGSQAWREVGWKEEVAHLLELVGLEVPRRPLGRVAELAAGWHGLGWGIIRNP